MKTISVVCRANEVRSRVVQAYLEYFLPGVEIRSFGIDIEKERRISQKLISSMKEWGLDIKTSGPRDVLTDLDFVSDSDFVIAADVDIARAIARYSSSVFDLTQHAIDAFHIPVDPVGFNASDTLINNAKVIHCTIRLLQHVTSESFYRNALSAIIPKVNSIIERDFEGYVIDARLKHYGEAVRSSESRLSFDREMLFSGQLESYVSEKRHLYAPRSEFFRPEQSLISREWLTFVQKVASMGPTVVITTPVFAGNISYPDSYLASVVAGTAHYL
jgi:protein-tyrosine-phosphatase